jgi:phenylalanyl-tRNA synthetase alpha chain
VRSVLAERCRSIEEISVVSEAPYAELSAVARERLGLSVGQKNVLLRLVVRDLARTLTSAEANGLRDEVYAAVHEGSVKSWAGRSEK